MDDERLGPKLDKANTSGLQDLSHLFRLLLMNPRSAIPLLAAFVTSISLVLTMPVFLRRLDADPKLPKYDQVMARVEQLATALQAQRDSLSEIRGQLEKLAAVPGPSEQALALSSLQSKTKILDDRLTLFESALLKDPATALSVPLLRQDVESIKSKGEADLESVERQVDRVYDQTKWFIGLMVAMAISLLGLSISQILQARKQ